MDISGKIIEIQPTQQITEAFRKREFVIEYAENPSYPEFIKFELIQDRCELLDTHSANEEVRVHFNLKGRKWTDRDGVVKYFNSLQAWKIDKMSAGEAPLSTPPPPFEAPPMPEDDDLPF